MTLSVVPAPGVGGWPLSARFPEDPSPIRSGPLPPDTVDLGLGDPSWGLDPDLWEHLLASIRSLPLGYGPHAGRERLRAAIARREGVTFDEVLITAGAQGALFSLTQAYLGPGDTAMVPDPGFPAYATLTRRTGATVVPYPLSPDRGFAPDVDEILDRIDRTPGTRLLFLNLPSNPTGALGVEGGLVRLIEGCRRRGVLPVLDEVYRDLTLGAPPPFPPHRPAGLATIGSLSKAWGAPALRVGWLLADPVVVEACRRVHAGAVTQVAEPSQALAIGLVESADAVLERSRRELRRRWRTLELVWREGLGEAPPAPAAGPYLWLPVPSAARSRSRRFHAELRDRDRVHATPGGVFGSGGESYFRISFAGPVDEIARGILRVTQGIARWTR